MYLCLQDCIDKLKKLQSGLYPNWYIIDKGKYMFGLLQRGVSKEESTLTVYAVDPESGEVAGPIPVMMLYGNPELASKLKKPHMCSPEEQKPLIHNSFQSDFLMHYGITGMKWGVRRFQNPDGSLTSAGKNRYSIGSDKSDIKDKPQKVGLFEKSRIKKAEHANQILEKMSKSYADAIDREKTKKGGLDKGRLAAEAALTVINPFNALNFAADGVGAAVAKGKLNSYFKHREEKSELDSKTGLYMKKEGTYNEKQDLAAVNPGFMNMNTNTKNNCMLCTTTYDMRQRGYDVTAQLDSEGYTFPDLKRWYPKAELKDNTRYDENGKALKQKEYVEKTMNSLIKQGDGARGNLMVWFTTGGGHSVVYEVKNGQLIIKDGQANMVMDGKISMSSANSSPRGFLLNTLVNSYARLDNVQPDLKKIKAECVR